MPKAIIFDLDDTLLWDKKSIERALHYTAQDAEKAYGVDSLKLVDAVRRIAPKIYSEYPTYAFTQTIGINPFEGLWGGFGDVVNHQFREMGRLMPDYRKRVWTEALRQCGFTGEREGERLSEYFIAHRREQPVLYEETFEVLDFIKKQGIQLLILTNGAPSLQLEKLAITPNIVPYFEHIIISGNIGIGKPSPVVFEHALRLVDLRTEDVWMVGDNKRTDILGANRIGMKSIWIQHEEATEVSRFDGKPDHTIKRLKELIQVIQEE
ncbi:HAD family hydrolase [Jeotgalibacillus marinus]|uniref:Phosphoserine phosphatase n=1 Tax=Jeotgalibacillus marinus TaxID=86667 RepID=A0ABV3Q4V0_9BACL